MSEFYIRTLNGEESLESYCKRLSKKNNSTLYVLEEYLGKTLLSEDILIEIRDTILTVSAEVDRLSKMIVWGDKDARL